MSNPTRIRFPLRLKLLVTVLVIVTAVVSAITFTMAALFHQDKRTYISDLVSMVSLSAAEESRMLFVGYRERLQTYARVLGRADLPENERRELMSGFFTDFPGLMSVVLVQNGQVVASASDSDIESKTGLSPDELEREANAATTLTAALTKSRTFVQGMSLAGGKVSCLRFLLALPAPANETRAIQAIVEMAPMKQLVARSKVMTISIWDAEGRLIVGGGKAFAPEVQADRERRFADFRKKRESNVTIEYGSRGREIIGGLTQIGMAGVMVSAEIPKSAAYLASRELLRNLILVALILLAVSAVVSVVWARQITGPLEWLTGASRKIGRGEFQTQVQVRSRDEIGALAESFNTMAAELHQRDTELREAHTQLVQSEKLAAFGQLGAGIAHEVKNPLAGILACAQISLRQAEEGTTLRKNVELIERETRRCKTIIDNLLKFARQEKALFADVDLNSALADAAAIANHQLELSHVKVHQDLATDLPVVRGNANQLQQVVLNLLINAQQAMKQQGGNVWLTSRAVETGVEVQVRDDGPGIPKEIQKKIFEPFFTTKPNGEGTGLGLSVSFGILKEHRGEIAVESEPGKGTTFTLSLPHPEALRKAA